MAEAIAMSEIINKASQIKSTENRIHFLKNHYSKALHEVMAYGYDKRVKWLLPPDPPPYKPLDNDPDAATGILYTEYRKFYLFVQGGHPTLKQVRRESIFVDLLEMLHPNDAKLVIDLANKKLPKGITQEVVEAAYGPFNG